MTNDNTAEAFVEQLKFDETLATTLYSCLKEWESNSETMYEHVAYFAHEQGYEVDVDVLKGLLDGVFPDDIIPESRPTHVRKQPAGALSDVVNPSKMGGDNKEGDVVFSHMYSRVGRKDKRD